MKNKIVCIGGAGFVGSRLQMELDNYAILDKKLTKEKYTDITKIETLSSKISNASSVVLLAAEHRDDVVPTSKYYLTNVHGTKNVLEEMDRVNCKHLIFTSSVAVYGLNKNCPDENHPMDPFNHYGKSKWEAEKLIKSWFENDPEGKSVTIIRPTVIFGEKNRGNVYNLLRQIALGRFLMIGKGNNKKSMAYVGNVVAFIKHRLELAETGYHVFNYVDKPDLTMSSLLKVVEKNLNQKVPSLKIPIWLGYFAGYCFDIIGFLTRKKLAVSHVRVKKFVATTQFDSNKLNQTSFKAPFSLEEGLYKTLNYEFIQERSDTDEVFYTE